MSPKSRNKRGDARLTSTTALQRARIELRRVSAALTEAQERERRRIAGELHDSIGQSLGAIATGVGVARDLAGRGHGAEAEQLLARVSQQIKETVEEVRRIAMNLRPASLDDLGITGTLSWFFREFGQIYPSLRIAPTIEVDEDEIPSGLRAPLFRVVQEAFNNTVKHSGASEIRVDLQRAPADLVLRVADDGRGFDHSGNGNGEPAGIGLTVMRNRVELTGGKFHLASEPGRGTVITACWPLGIDTERDQ